MSWSGGFFIAKIKKTLKEGAFGIAKKNNFEKEICRLLSLKATENEAEELKAQGFEIKMPTKLTLLAVALYSKAVKGDLSALKEICSRLAPDIKEGGGVVLIDDIRDTD